MYYLIMKIMIMIMKKRHASSNEQFLISEINTLFMTYNCDLELTKILCK